MTVLVAYNTSPQGESALRAAATEAARRRLPLAVVVLTPEPPGGLVPPDLAHLLDALPDGVEVTSVTYRPEHVDPADAILDEAERLGASLVVVGSRKRPAVGTFLLGTTTQRVLLDASVPVLVVKAAHG